MSVYYWNPDTLTPEVHDRPPVPLGNLVLMDGPRPSPQHVPDGTAWVLSLAAVAAERDATIRNRTRQEIEKGFSSAGLGSAHFYPSTETDQQNLSANVTSALLDGAPEGWTTKQLCRNGAGVWAYRDHTAAQIQQVGRDGKARVMACLLNGAALRADPDADIESGWPS